MEEIEVPKPILVPISGKKQKCVGNMFSHSFNEREKKLICVTSGNSYLGSFIVKGLLAHGYLVRVTIQHPGTYYHCFSVFFLFFFWELQSCIDYFSQHLILLLFFDICLLLS